MARGGGTGSASASLAWLIRITWEASQYYIALYGSLGLFLHIFAFSIKE